MGFAPEWWDSAEGEQENKASGVSTERLVLPKEHIGSHTCRKKIVLPRKTRRKLTLRALGSQSGIDSFLLEMSHAFK